MPRKRVKRFTVADMTNCPVCTQDCWTWELDPDHPWQPKHVHGPVDQLELLQPSTS